MLQCQAFALRKAVGVLSYITTITIHAYQRQNWKHLG